MCLMLTDDRLHVNCKTKKIHTVAGGSLVITVAFRFCAFDIQVPSVLSYTENVMFFTPPILLRTSN